jgi:uncharacterized membrane protein
MKFINIIIAALLPLSALAAPAPVAEPDAAPAPSPEKTYAIPIAVADDTTTPAIKERDLFTRSTQICQIIGSSSRVNCRAGPSTSSDITHYVYLGSYYKFTCYKSGTCVTLGGTTNWYVSALSSPKGILSPLYFMEASVCGW